MNKKNEVGRPKKGEGREIANIALYKDDRDGLELLYKHTGNHNRSAIIRSLIASAVKKIKKN